METKITKFKDIPQFTKTGNYQANYNLKSLIKYIEEEVEEQGLDLNPDFQRGHVWTEEQQIAYIEYFLRGGTSGRTIYFNCPDWQSYGKRYPGGYVCVDGLQRITAISRFIHNEIKVFGSYFNEFEDSIRMLPHMIEVNVNNLKTKQEVLQWYIDMNAGGTPHTKEDIDKVRTLLQKENNSI